MAKLVNVEEAVKKLCEFLESSRSSSTAGKGDGVESLFAPAVSNKSFGVDVEVAFLASPSAHRVPLYVLLPHEVMLGNICLITPTPESAFESKVLSLTDNGDDMAKRVRRVLDTRSLNTKFVDPVAVRAFSKSYDNFVVYGVHKYPRQLTGEFLGHQRIPVWVPKKEKLASALDRATRTAVVPRRGDNAVTCRVGHTGLSTEELVENVAAFVDGLSCHPQGAPLSHILHIRVAGTNADGKRVGLPVYAHTFDFSRVPEPPSKKVKMESG